MSNQESASTIAINYVVYGIRQCKAFDVFRPRGYVEPILYTIIDPISALCI